MNSHKKYRYKDDPLPPEKIERLKAEVLTGRKPLGSEFFEYNHANLDSDLYQILFDGHSTYLYEGRDERPSIIVGRKGAGKSTYLHNLACKPRIIPIRIINWKLISEVQQIISIIINDGQEIRAERASYILQWFMLAITALEINAEDSNSELIDRFMKYMPRESYAEEGSDVLTGFVSEQIRSVAKGEKSKEDVDCKSILWIMEDRTRLIDQVEIELNRILKASDKVAIVLFDNEEFVLAPAQGHEGELLQTAKEISISGLLNLCGRSNVGATSIQLRYCIPAEQFFAFKELSKTVGKDFSNMHLLHWTVGELMSLIAHRYLLHLNVWKDDRPEYDAIYKQLVEYDIYSRSGAFQLIQEILPDKIRNGRGIPEDTMTYIARHFQVLPRQLLAAFNAIISNALDENSFKISPISENAVVSAIRGKEGGMADEIIRAYLPRFPEAESIRKNVLPNMPLVFNYSDIRQYYDRKDLINNAKSVLKGFKDQGVPISPERFERCLVETGMVGRVEDAPGQNKRGYINVKFEYSMPSRLIIGQNDKLAVHPLFSSDSIQRANDAYGPNVYGVYPTDTDPELDPDRYLIRQRFCSN